VRITIITPVGVMSMNDAVLMNDAVSMNDTIATASAVSTSAWPLSSRFDATTVSSDAVVFVDGVSGVVTVEGSVKVEGCLVEAVQAKAARVLTVKPIPASPSLILEPVGVRGQGYGRHQEQQPQAKERAAGVVGMAGIARTASPNTATSFAGDHWTSSPPG